jgi:hypothetical protein
MIELSQEQLIAYIRGELELGKVSSVYEPDGIFYSMEEKRQIIEWLNDEENRNSNK